MFEFSILSKDLKTKARVGEFHTPHGKLLTPELAFVATEGELKSIPKDILPKLPVNLIIVNTFHLWVKNILHWPKSNRRGQNKAFGIHNYANFDKPIMSDSGGFQVFSLGFSKVHRVGKIAKIFPGERLESHDRDNPLIIDSRGVKFPYDGKQVTLTPELSISLQEKIGADIIFAFDEVTSPLNTKPYTKKALERTHDWLERCFSAKKRKDQALFAIVQGGYFEDLRKKSVHFVGKQDVSGFGIGGTLGRSKDDMHNVLEWIIPLLPDEKPRHLLGIGQVRDIFEAVERGVDLFDCVIPTREARHKVLYTKKGRINIKKMRTVEEVIEKGCRCLACAQKVTYSQLNELFSKKDSRAFFFATVHNIQFYADLMSAIRETTENSMIPNLKEKILRYY